MSWTAPITTFVVNEVLTAAEMNAIGANLLALYDSPLTMAVPTPASTQTISSSSSATLALGTAQYDPGGFWQTGSYELLVPVGGDYGIVASVSGTVADAGPMRIQILVNGSTVYQVQRVAYATSADYSMTVVGTVPNSSPGDTIAIQVANETSGDFDVLIDGTYTYCHTFIRSYL